MSIFALTLRTALALATTITTFLLACNAIATALFACIAIATALLAGTTIATATALLACATLLPCTAIATPFLTCITPAATLLTRTTSVIQRVAIVWGEVSEELRRLDDSQCLFELIHAQRGVPDVVVGDEPLTEVRSRDEVGIQRHYEVGSPLKRVVEIAGLGMAIVRADDVVNVLVLLAQLRDHTALEGVLAVITEVNGEELILNRATLQEARYYPYHSITEDTAMSLCFYSLGYNTYWVNESLATGLATTSLWSNLSQRARWLKGDWQILFSKKGPLTARGLGFIQRVLYLHMTFSRLISVVHLMYDIAAILLLVAAISPLDAPEPLQFIIYITTLIVAGLVVRTVLTMGGQGLDKSEAGSVAFEDIFRYITVKGLFIALFNTQNLKFKVTDKSGVPSNDKDKAKRQSEELVTEPEPVEKFVENARFTVLGRPAPKEAAVHIIQLVTCTFVPL